MHRVISLAVSTLLLFSILTVVPVHSRVQAAELEPEESSALSAASECTVESFEIRQIPGVESIPAALADHLAGANLLYVSIRYTDGTEALAPLQNGFDHRQTWVRYTYRDEHSADGDVIRQYTVKLFSEEPNHAKAEPFAQARYDLTFQHTPADKAASRSSLTLRVSELKNWSVIQVVPAVSGEYSFKASKTANISVLVENDGSVGTFDVTDVLKLKQDQVYTIMLIQPISEDKGTQSMAPEEPEEPEEPADCEEEAPDEVTQYIRSQTIFGRRDSAVGTAARKHPTSFSLQVFDSAIPLNQDSRLTITPGMSIYALQPTFDAPLIYLQNDPDLMSQTYITIQYTAELNSSLGFDLGGGEILPLSGLTDAAFQSSDNVHFTAAIPATAENVARMARCTLDESACVTESGTPALYVIAPTAYTGAITLEGVTIDQIDAAIGSVELHDTEGEVVEPLVCMDIYRKAYESFTASLMFSEDKLTIVTDAGDKLMVSTALDLLVTDQLPDEAPEESSEPTKPEGTTEPSAPAETQPLAALAEPDEIPAGTLHVILPESTEPPEPYKLPEPAEITEPTEPSATAGEDG